jgi:hypothetical protein
MGFSWFSSLLPGKCRNSTFKIMPRPFLPNPFQFINHLSPFHSIFNLFNISAFLFRCTINPVNDLRISHQLTRSFFCPTDSLPSFSRCNSHWHCLQFIGYIFSRVLLIVFCVRVPPQHNINQITGKYLDQSLSEASNPK